MSVSTASITGPKTLALSVDAIPSSNPPNSGHVELTLVLVRKLQA
jgi:hypothetical protein